MIPASESAGRNVSYPASMAALCTHRHRTNPCVAHVPQMHTLQSPTRRYPAAFHQCSLFRTPRKPLPWRWIDQGQSLARGSNLKFSSTSRLNFRKSLADGFVAISSPILIKTHLASDPSRTLVSQGTSMLCIHSPELIGQAPLSRPKSVRILRSSGTPIMASSRSTVASNALRISM